MTRQPSRYACSRSPIPAAIALAAAVALAACSDTADSPLEASAEGRYDGAHQQMVVAAHPLAATAGQEILRQGGSALDAAIATQLVLNLVEPQSSGIGGGAFLLHYRASDRSVSAYDGRETAPRAAGPDLFLGADGKPMEFWSAVIGGRSVGVPGLLAMLKLAHDDHGKLPWDRLFEPAIALADEGFMVTERLAASIAGARALNRFPAAAAYFFTPDGTPLPEGSCLKNPAFAETLRRIAAEGPEAFYEGPLAAEIVRSVRGAAGNPGLITEADLAAYRAKRREPLSLDYRRWQLYGMPPPTSGGVAVLQILGLLERFDLAAQSPTSAETAHLIAEAERLAFADRDRFLADPDFVEVPVAALLDPDYLARRSALIDPARSLDTAEPGLPAVAAAMPRQPDPPSTSHLVVVDRDGNAVSMTTSIESGFGSRLMVGGFLLNNELTDFSFAPESGGRPVANRVEAGKRPRSSMAPLLVLDREGRLVAALGSPGGSRIIGYVARAATGILDWGLTPQQAVSLPHVVNRNGPTDLEAGTRAEALKPALQARGHEVRVMALDSGLHALAAVRDGYLGGADPRREGYVAGDQPPVAGRLLPYRYQPSALEAACSATRLPAQ
ncbi:MAG: gamma-glutamyltransferase [Kiloniellales bacterium]